MRDGGGEGITARQPAQVSGGRAEAGALPAREPIAPPSAERRERGLSEAVPGEVVDPMG